MPNSRILRAIIVIIWLPWLIPANILALLRLHFIELKDPHNPAQKVVARVVTESPWGYEISIPMHGLQGDVFDRPFFLPRKDRHIVQRVWGALTVQ